MERCGDVPAAVGLAAIKLQAAKKAQSRHERFAATLRSAMMPSLTQAAPYDSATPHRGDSEKNVRIAQVKR